MISTLKRIFEADETNTDDQEIVDQETDDEETDTEETDDQDNAVDEPTETPEPDTEPPVDTTEEPTDEPDDKTAIEKFQSEVFQKDAFDFNIENLDEFIDIKSSVRAMCKMRFLMRRKDEVGLYANMLFHETEKEHPKVIQNSRTSLFYAVDPFYLLPIPTVGFLDRETSEKAWRLWVSFNRLTLRHPEEDVDQRKKEPDLIRSL